MTQPTHIQQKLWMKLNNIILILILLLFIMVEVHQIILMEKSTIFQFQDQQGQQDQQAQQDQKVMMEL